MWMQWNVNEYFPEIFNLNLKDIEKRNDSSLFSKYNEKNKYCCAVKVGLYRKYEQPYN